MNSLDKAVASNAAVLLSMVSAIREGNKDAIHDARVAGRRLQAALPIAWAGRAELGRTRRIVRRACRALGRSRDTDIALDVLAGAELRIPGAASAIGVLRTDLVSRQDVERRRLIKRLEKLAVSDIAPAPGSGIGRLASSVAWRSDPRWTALERALGRRADRVRASVESAGGIYFPNRLHTVRSDVKRLRYLLELVPGSASGLRLALKKLRKAQEALGTMHDRQVVADLIADNATLASDPATADHCRLLQSWITADILDLHAEYLDRRSDLLQVGREVEDAVARNAWRPWTVGRALMAAGVVAAPAAAAFLKDRLAPAGSPEDRAKTPVEGDRHDALRDDYDRVLAGRR